MAETLNNPIRLHAWLEAQQRYAFQYERLVGSMANPRSPRAHGCPGLATRLWVKSPRSRVHAAKGCKHATRCCLSGLRCTVLYNQLAISPDNTINLRIRLYGTSSQSSLSASVPTDPRPNRTPAAARLALTFPLQRFPHAHVPQAPLACNACSRSFRLWPLAAASNCSCTAATASWRAIGSRRSIATATAFASTTTRCGATTIAAPPSPAPRCHVPTCSPARGQDGCAGGRPAAARGTAGVAVRADAIVSVTPAPTSGGRTP